jgi:hypothetical protein
MGIVPVRIQPRNRSLQPVATWGRCLDLNQAENVRVLLDWGRRYEGIQRHRAQARIRGKNSAGAGGLQLQNEKGVILQLAGAKVGVEVSAAVGGVTITLKWA